MVSLCTNDEGQRWIVTFLQCLTCLCVPMCQRWYRVPARYFPNAPFITAISLAATVANWPSDTPSLQKINRCGFTLFILKKLTRRFRSILPRSPIYHEASLAMAHGTEDSQLPPTISRALSCTFTSHPYSTPDLSWEATRAAIEGMQVPAPGWVTLNVRITC